MTQESSVSISEASHILGVSEASLRLWTDEGKIRAFITPGGHRRYSKDDLKKFMSSHLKTLGVKDLVVQLEDTAQVLREITINFLPTTSWYNKLSQESQQCLGGLGRRFLSLIIRYVAEPSKREETIALAHDAGREFGETLAKLGLPLTDSVHAFILHRDPVIRAVTHLMKKREVFAERIVGAIPMVDRVLDEALVSLVAAHQQYRNSHQQLEQSSSK